MNILVTGASGQLGKTFAACTGQYPDHNFYFVDRTQLDITDFDRVAAQCNTIKPDVIINCAAYTAVDKAETEVDTCHAINHLAVANIAQYAAEKDILLVHYSTDYVYHLDTTEALSETMDTHPQGEYAKSKKLGEEAIRAAACDHLIIRTSWVYSEFGHNFVKTMIRLGNERDSLSIVNDQIGAPTYTHDIVEGTMTLIEKNINNTPRDTYNYSNTGRISWYDFAQRIFEIAEIDIEVKSIPSSQYPTPAPRPHWSVMSLDKISRQGVRLHAWQDSLQRCMDKLG